MAERHSIAGFEVVRSLGVGALTEVFLARSSDGQPAVLKRLHRHLAADPDVVGLLDHEARLLGVFDHEGIPRLLGRYEDDRCPVLALTMLPGVGLDQRPAGPMAVDAAASLMVRLLSVLDHVNRASQGGEGLGVVHRDLSPPNVLVSDDGRVSLVDFGIATSRWRPDPDRGRMKGSRGYMAPEVITGEVEADARSDLFVVGVLFYELVTGQRCFAGNAMEVMLQTVEGPLPRTGEGRVDAVLDHLLVGPMASRDASAARASQRLRALAKDAR